MKILGIESSCDETAASVVEDGRTILSHVIASSQEMHTKTGGIIPEKAAREQVKSIIPVIEEALNESFGWQASHKQSPPIEAIGVTVGPGLIGSLLVGIETAKVLSYVWNKPIIPVNHLAAHIYANWIHDDDKTKDITLPAISLVVSGGHTDLVLLKKHGDMEWIGGTRDDAAGEAFDKSARLLGLPYPGGPSIAKQAKLFKTNRKSRIKLPRPMIDENNFDFSFSGLKTALNREFISSKEVAQGEFAYELQEAITDVLVEKTLNAVKKFKVKTLLVAGGVAANERLKEKFKKRISELNLRIDFRVPPPSLCTDNASYVASFAFYNYHPVSWNKVFANPNLTITGA